MNGDFCGKSSLNSGFNSGEWWFQGGSMPFCWKIVGRTWVVSPVVNITDWMARSIYCKWTYEEFSSILGRVTGCWMLVGYAYIQYNTIQYNTIHCNTNYNTHYNTHYNTNYNTNYKLQYNTIPYYTIHTHTYSFCLNFRYHHYLCMYICMYLCLYVRVCVYTLLFNYLHVF